MAESTKVYVVMQDDGEYGYGLPVRIFTTLEGAQKHAEEMISKKEDGPLQFRGWEYDQSGLRTLWQKNPRWEVRYLSPEDAVADDWSAGFWVEEWPLYSGKGEGGK